MQKRYWFYVRSAGSLLKAGKHRVCVSPSDDQTSFTNLLQSAFCVKSPAFKLYVLIAEDGEVMDDSAVCAAEAAAETEEEGDEEGPPKQPFLPELAFVSIATVLADLKAYAHQVAERNEQQPAPPAMCVFVDSETPGEHHPQSVVERAYRVAFYR
jgi:hypothetical protein